MPSHESQFSSSQQEPAGSHAGCPGKETPAGGAQRRRAEPPPGAPPSNTAPGNSKGGEEGGCRVLRHGLDSLYVSFYGKLYREKANALFELRNRAQSQYERDQALAIYSHGEHHFAVNGKRSKQFAYLLSNPCYHLSLASVTAVSVPMAYVQIKSSWLTEHGVRGAVDQLIEIIEKLGVIEEGPNVSRADLFVDAVTGLHLEALSRDYWVTRARTIDDYGGSRYSTGFTIGRGGDIVGRLYDKTEEIKVSGKEYLKALWSEKGWQPGETVHRLEFQTRSTVLRQFGITQMDTLLARCGGLWRYFTGEWLKLVVPNPEDDTRSRWPVHPVWTCLHGSPWEGTGVATRIHAVTNSIPPAAQLASRSLSALVSVMAAQGIDDPEEGVQAQHQLMKDHYDGLAFFAGTDFEGLLREKLRLKRRAYGAPDAETLHDRDAMLTEAAAEVYRKERDGE